MIKKVQNLIGDNKTAEHVRPKHKVGRSFQREKLVADCLRCYWVIFCSFSLNSKYPERTRFKLLLLPSNPPVRKITITNLEVLCSYGYFVVKLRIEFSSMDLCFLGPFNPESIAMTSFRDETVIIKRKFGGQPIWIEPVTYRLWGEITL